MALQDSHQLAQVQTSLPAGRKQSKEQSNTVSAQTGCLEEKISVSFVTLGEHLKPIRQEQNKAKKFLAEQGLTWDKSWIIIPNYKFDEVIPPLQDMKSSCDDLFREFMDSYESTVADELSKMGTAVTADDFPTISKMMHSYRFDIHSAEVPSPDADPRAGWSAEQIKSLTESHKQRYESAVKQATIDMLGRVEEPLRKLSEKMVGYTGTREGSFNDSIVHNLEKVIEKMIEGNLTDDPEIKDLHGRIVRQLDGINPASLRGSESLREEVHNKAGALAVDARELIERVATCEGLAL
jgi:hypothetical protein